MSFSSMFYLPSEYYDYDHEEEENNNKSVEMPDGTDGFYCFKCTNFFSYVDKNHENGYMCYNCRFWEYKKNNK